MLDFHSVTFAYEDKLIFNNVNCTIHHNSFTCVVGMNGTGKSTFARLAVGALTPQKGRITYNQRPLDQIKIGYLQQRLVISDENMLAVKDFVMMGLLKPKKLFFKAHEIARAEREIAKCDLTQEIYTPMKHLSRGQLQKALIARLLVSDPEYIVLDEPFESLDVQASDMLLEKLRTLKSKITVLMISHNMDMISSLADNVLCISHKEEHHQYIDYFLKKKHIPITHTVCQT